MLLEYSSNTQLAQKRIFYFFSIKNPQNSLSILLTTFYDSIHSIVKTESKVL